MRISEQTHAAAMIELIKLCKKKRILNWHTMGHRALFAFLIIVGIHQTSAQLITCSGNCACPTGAAANGTTCILEYVFTQAKIRDQPQAHLIQTVVA